MNTALANARRVVVKIGSALLIDETAGIPRQDWVDALAADLARMREAGVELVIVSSGAIALGRRVLDLPPGALRLDESQAAAAAGQIRLASAYETALAAHNIPVAQVLLTLSDSEDRRRYLNARGTLSTLVQRGAVPVINENDTVATEEIRFGDNDRLAARVAAMIGADCLVLLSDIDGLYTADPRHDGQAEFLPHVNGIDRRVEEMAGEAGAYGSGGMVTKLAAAKIALGAGCHMVIGNGRQPHALDRLRTGADRCTWFEATTAPHTAYKQWIAGSLDPKGMLRVDAGAVSALRDGRSLLAAGVETASGQFGRGDAVIIADQTGHELARGIVAYDLAEARRICRHKTSELEAVLGYPGRGAMVHRDDLVITGLPIEQDAAFEN